MGHPKRLRIGAATAALAVLALAAGCAQMQSMQASIRNPGEKNLELPDEVAVEYNCPKRPLPFFEVEKYEVIPDHVKAGKELAHRLEYVMCPKQRTEVIAGELTTSILFKGKVIVTDSESYDLKPGRWRKDQSIQLPTSAEPGVYSLDVEFAGSGSRFEKQASFIVLSSD